VSFDGSTSVTAAATIQPDSVALGSDTTGNYVKSLTAGTGLSGTVDAEGSTPTLAIDSSVATLTGSQTLTNKYLSGATANTVASASDSSTKIATTAFVQAAVDLEDSLAEMSGDSDDITEGSANLFLTTTERTKLGAVDVSADVTDATTVAAAGAVMEADTTTASMSFVLDEDNMGSGTPSDTKVATQQSIKAYVDSQLGFSAGDGLDLTGVVFSLENASASNIGGVELALEGEVATGTDGLRAVTPESLENGYQGTSNIATIGTVTAGELSNGASIGTVTTNLGSDVVGDIYYSNASLKLTRLPKGSNDDILTLASGLPSWSGTIGTKLDGIEELADVTDTANVTSAGALMTTGGTMSGALGVGRTPTTYELEVAGEAQITSTGAGGVLGLVNAQGNLWIGVDTTSAYLQTSSGEDFRIVADSTVALTAATDGAVDLAASKLKIGGSYGTDGHVLTSTGSGVAWEAPTAVTVTGATQAAITSAANLATVGTITTGTWEGTTIAVDQGGTGATSLTSGSVLLGSGTGAITAMNVLAAGEIIIGDGVGDPSKLVIGADNSAITILGTIGTGVWNGTAIDGAYVDIEGTEVKSAGPITDGYVLTADGSGGAAWEASAGGGKVLQVLNNTGTVADASATSATAAVSQAITPAASSNTVLVTAIANFSLDHDDDNFETGDMRWQLFRGSTALGNEQKYVNNNSGLSWTANTMYYCCSFTFKDSPATASAATYSLKYYQANTANPVAVVHDAQITVQEID
jgi:hypothetical protein